MLPIVNLGNQALTGVFPKDMDQSVTTGPLELVRCNDEKNTNACGLLQLKHSLNSNELCGINYGYRSGLNKSMVQHLQTIVDVITSIVQLKKGDYVLDIGSNDGTLLSLFPDNIGINLVGVDPTGKKFVSFYQKRIQLIPNFFSAHEITKNVGPKKMKVITSISMFYDLESPIQFINEVMDVLDDDGIWVIEQSYLPAMLEVTAYDTICHEHLEYYSLKQIIWMTERVGLKIIALSLNNSNGGSFSVILAKQKSTYPICSKEIAQILKTETNMRLNTSLPFEQFNTRIQEHKNAINQFFISPEFDNKLILGYGASTKGNVIIKYCGLSKEQLPFIVEVNPDKFGSFTPGSLIPIISETQGSELNPNCYFVLPWHFRKGIIEKEQQRFLQSGGKLFFPLPKLELYSI